MVEPQVALTEKKKPAEYSNSVQSTSGFSKHVQDFKMQNSKAGNRRWEKRSDVVNLSFKDKSFKSKVITALLWIWGLPAPPSPPPKKILREIRGLQQDERTKSHPIEGSSVRAGRGCFVFFAVAWGGGMATPASAFSSSGFPSVTDHFQLQHPGIHSFLALKRFAFSTNHLGRLSCLFLHSREY